MVVDREAAIAVTSRGVAYCFCDDACADIFRDEPERRADEQPLDHDH